MLSRAAVAANLDALAEAWAWTDADLLVHALPLFHVHGLVLGILGPLRRGGTVHHLGSLDAAALAAAGPGMVFGVPTQYHRLADQLESDPESAAAIGRARLLVSGSAALTAVDHARLRDSTGLAVRERYGLTETLILTAARAGDEPEPGTVGHPVRDTEVRLAPLPDPDPSAEDGLGAVEVRGPALFDGYLNRPDATAAAHTADGWFATGDIGRFTASGALALVGRSATDLIKSGGFKIGAGEIENALLEHPGVAEVAVVGRPDADLGERIVAFVVPAGAPPAERELVDHVAGLLAPHKRPREVRFVEVLPRNDMGKVVKSRLAGWLTEGELGQAGAGERHEDPHREPDLPGRRRGRRTPARRPARRAPGRDRSAAGPGDRALRHRGPPAGRGRDRARRAPRWPGHAGPVGAGPARRRRPRAAAGTDPARRRRGPDAARRAGRADPRVHPPASRCVPPGGCGSCGR